MLIRENSRGSWHHEDGERMEKKKTSKITKILAAINQGDSDASQDLFTAVYQELRKMARFKMAQERPGHTLQPTALVHEAYIRLMAGEGAR